MTPDFAEFILATPMEERTGRVFKLTCRRITAISDVLSRFGERAEMKVNTDQRTGK